MCSANWSVFILAKRSTRFFRAINPVSRWGSYKLKSLLIPSFEEGPSCRSKNVTLPSEIGATGEVRPLLQQVSDLPGSADSKVALHFFDRRRHPSSQEGIKNLYTHSAHSRSRTRSNAADV